MRSNCRAIVQNFHPNSLSFVEKNRSMSHQRGRISTRASEVCVEMKFIIASANNLNVLHLHSQKEAIQSWDLVVIEGIEGGTAQLGRVETTVSSIFISFFF